MLHPADDRVVIIDLGSACMVISAEQRLAFLFKGRQNAGPEAAEYDVALSGYQEANVPNTPARDSFSAGVILYEHVRSDRLENAVS
jgi:hypothetical protein